MEYREFAKYYDEFYQKKNYEKEVEFLKNFISKDDLILDVGCGTGMHASFLEKDGYLIEGLDLNKEMLEIARTRLKGNVYTGNILEFSSKKKYDVIIFMFAVINHLKNLEELKVALINMKEVLSFSGKIIIDLHNPLDSGSKKDVCGRMERTMEWFYDENSKIENSKITFFVDGKIYEDAHTFCIFTIEEIESVANSLGLAVRGVFENYDIERKGNSKSKNLQFLLENV